MASRLRKISPYWVFQLGGWTLYYLVFATFYLTQRTQEIPRFFECLLADVLFFLMLTHLMRMIIKQQRLLDKPIPVQVMGFLGLTFLLSFALAVLSNITYQILGYETENMRKAGFRINTMRTAVGAFLFLFMWNSVYIIYHYIFKSRRDLVERLRLENLLKEMELNTIKAHINPHFIFNALNSIRALVDEDPQLARTAITQLSNILRSSMQTDSLRTTPLHKELSIVQDYLALEHIRFEQRLRVSYDIDEQSLDSMVPPMMLQTLVENAIKHGISKQVKGGHIHIKSEKKNQRLRLLVNNTGQLAAEPSAEGTGFGLSSTNHRLKLLYGGDAAFSIHNQNASEVEAVVELPVENEQQYNHS